MTKRQRRSRADMRAMCNHVVQLLGRLGAQRATQLTRAMPNWAHTMHHTPRREMALEGGGRQRAVSYEHLVRYGREPGVGGEDDMLELLDARRGNVGQRSHGVGTVPNPKAMLSVCRRLREYHMVVCVGAGKSSRWRLTWLGTQVHVATSVYAALGVTESWTGLMSI